VDFDDDDDDDDDVVVESNDDNDEWRIGLILLDGDNSMVS
jgi:hypothetical protein